MQKDIKKIDKKPSNKELVAWFKRRPKWLQEAANRLLNNNVITESDINELVELCKKEAVEEINVSKLSLQETLLRENKTISLQLHSISNVQGINALAPREPLVFGDKNLSIIYGQNGSGKSGYVRILKHACGARAIKPLRFNVYSPAPSCQKCSIEYKLEGSSIKNDWEVKSGVIDDLNSVEIIDTSSGRVYVTEENEACYEPPVLSFFSNLIYVCEKISTILKNEVTNLKSAKPILPKEYNDTVSGQWYVKFSKNVKQEDITKHCEWTDKAEKKLVNIQKRLSEQDPTEKAKQFRKQIQHADALIKSTEAFIELFSDKNCQQLIDLRNQVILKNKVATVVANKVFKDASLDGVGSEIWKDLWEQARKYSQAQAYKDIEFPFTGDGAHCVLCQQLLSDEAKKRIQSFEIFIKGETQKEAESAKKKLDERLNSIGEVISQENLKIKMAAAGLNTECSEHVEAIYSELRTRKEELQKANSADSLTSLSKYDGWITELKGIVAFYKDSAKNYDDDAKQENRTELIKIRDELKAKKWLSQQRKPIENEVKRLKEIDILDDAIKLTDTKGLSRKKGELSETLITSAFISRFNEELRSLGAKRIKIELIKTRVNRGRVLHRLQLKNINNESAIDILSEGEFKIISLAAFIADVGGNDISTPLIFDDPISSLDQNFEEAVVQRLVDLAKYRQVIVFTHRLSLLGLLQDYAKKTEVDSNVVCIRQESWGTGEPGDVDLFIKKPIKALNLLLNEKLPKARKILENQGREAYIASARSICTNYRIILERIIESEFLADVVCRYRRAINTLGKINKISRITDSDCKLIDGLMTKYSRYEHSQPMEAPVMLPNPDELEEDIIKLKSWHEEFNKRDTK